MSKKTQQHADPNDDCTVKQAPVCDPGGDTGKERRPNAPERCDTAYLPFPVPGPCDIPDVPKAQLHPRLVIRNAPGDTGARPVVSLGGGSPDITVTGPTTTLITLTGTFYLVPAPGSDQSIAARIWNFGSDDVLTARIRFWEVRTLQGSDPQPSLIGRLFRPIPANSSVIVHCPTVWTPTTPSRLSTMVDVSDSVNDPITSPFEPLSDRHVAQDIIVRE